MGLAPFFSTSQSDWTDLPGIYISERNTPVPFLGVHRNAVGVCGECVRGPVNTPVSITDTTYFTSIFGGRDRGDGGPILGQVWTSLLGKRFGEIVVVRVAAAGAVAGTLGLTSTGPVTNITVTAASVGDWADDLTVAVEAASNGVATSRDIVVTYLGVATRLANLNVLGTANNLASVVASVWPDANQRLVNLTKGTAGTPDIAAAVALASGADGAVADSDYTAVDGPMEKLASRSGLVAVWVAERDHTTAIKNKWETLAAASYDRAFLIGPEDSTTSQATAITDVASYRHKRISYLYNFPLTQDPSTASNITVRPESWLASVLSQTASDVHPISLEAAQYLTGIKDLTLSPTRTTHIALKNAGIMALDFDRDNLVKFATGITTSLTSGEADLAQRRMRDALEIDLAELTSSYVGKKNSDENRRMILAAIADYLQAKQDAQVVVDDFAQPSFISTNAEEAAGLAKIAVRVKTFGHWLYLVLDTQMGPNVSIEESDTLPAAA